MASPELIEQLNYHRAYRANRLRAAHWVIDHPDCIPELLHYCFEDTTELSYKAAWAFEFVFIEDPGYLYPYFDYFFRMLPTVKLDQIARPMAHICERLCVRYYKKQDAELEEFFKEDHKKILTECAFDWLITDQKVACQVRAMTCLYYLGTEFDWIHPELEQILRERIHLGSAGYKSRAGKTLEQITKFNS
jgi:hypothetical protein